MVTDVGWQRLETRRGLQRIEEILPTLLDRYKSAEALDEQIEETSRIMIGRFSAADAGESLIAKR